MQLEKKCHGQIRSPAQKNHSIFEPDLTFVFTSCAIAVLLCIVLPAKTVAAQTAGSSPSQAAQEGLRRQEERLKEQLQQQRPTQDILRPESKEIVTTVPPEESPCFEIKEIRFTG